MNPCNAYVNSDGSLTQEGVRARNCIINGGLLSAEAILTGRSTSDIIFGLELAATLTHCDGIVDFQKLKSATNPTFFLKELGIG